MMTGGSQTGSVHTVVVFHDQTVYGILKLLRVVRSDSLTQQLIIAVAIYVGKGHYGEASILKLLQLSQFGVALQIIRDQVKGKELQESLPRLICIQLSRATGRQAPGMRIGFLQTGIDQFEMLP